MSFGGIKNTELTQEEQKRIHYLCMSYNQMMPNLRHKMKGLCDLAGGKYCDALFEVLTNKYETVKEIAGKHSTNEKKLYTLRKMFFEHFSLLFSDENNIKYINKTEEKEMIINHSETKNIIVKALEKCHEVVNISVKLFQDCEKIRADRDLVPDAKDRKTLEIETDAGEKVRGICSELDELANGFEKAEEENSLCFDVSDAKVIGVTEIIKSMGNEADAELCETVVETFKGQYLALKYLKSLFKKNGLTTQKIDSDYDSYLSTVHFPAGINPAAEQ